MSFTRYLQFVEAHVKLVLGVAALVVLFLVSSRWIDHAAKVADEHAAAAQAQLVAVRQQNADLEKIVAADQAQYLQLKAAFDQQNRLLTSAIVARNQATAQQQKTDLTLPLPDLGRRWAGLAGFSAERLQYVNGQITVPDPEARATVQQLELVPTLQQNLAAETAIAENKDKELSQLTVVNLDLGKQVAGLKEEVQKTDAAGKAELKKCQADARKGKFKAFKIGFVVGFASGIATRFLPF